MAALKKIMNFIHSPFAFKLTAIVVYIFNNVPSDFDLENIPMKIVFAWGAYLIAKDFFTKRIMFKQKYWYILLALVTSFAISVVLNFPYHFPDNAYNWVYLMQTVFLIYPFDHSQSFEKTKSQMILFNDVFIWILTVLVTVSLILFVFNIEYWVLAGTGTHWIRQGFMESRLFGLFTSPNFGSMLGFLSVCLSIFNNEMKRSSWKKFQPLYVYNLIIQYLYYILSSSRGTHLTILTGIFVGTLYILYRIIRNSQAKWKKSLKTIVFVFVGTFALASFTSSAQEVLSYVPVLPQIVNQAIEDFNEEENQGPKELSNQKEPVKPVTIQHSEPGKEISSGRFTIWKAGISSTLQRPFFGLSDADMYRGVKPYEAPNQVELTDLDQLDLSEIRRAGGNMHNVYVSIFVFSGIIGSLIFFIFTVLIAIYHLKSLMNCYFDWSQSINRLYGLIFLMLIALIGNNLVESHIIFANRNSIGFVFWIYLGFMAYLKPYLTYGEKTPEFQVLN